MSFAWVDTPSTDRASSVAAWFALSCFLAFGCVDWFYPDSLRATFLSRIQYAFSVFVFAPTFASTAILLHETSEFMREEIGVIISFVGACHHCRTSVDFAH